MIDGTFDKEVKRSKKRRSGSRKKGSKKKHDKEKHHSKTHVHYPPHGSYGGKIFTSLQIIDMKST